MPAAKPRPDTRLAQPLAALAARDPDIARAFATAGLPPVRSSPTGFPGLLRIIVAQQVSTASAAAILGRLRARLPALTPEAFLALDEAEHRAVGFSRAKSRYAIALAEAMASGTLSHRRLARLDDAGVLAALSALPGFGRWSAECYLLFALRRPDVMPAGDLALQVAAGRLKNLAARPSEKQLLAMSEAWRPHRSAAARFLWHFYRHPGVPDLAQRQGAPEA
jgi:DNA-3-methyladenine glycosylase II